MKICLLIHCNVLFKVHTNSTDDSIDITMHWGLGQ